MPLTIDSVLQEATGGAGSGTSITVSLPAGTTAGTTVILVVQAGVVSAATVPTGWVTDSTVGPSGTSASTATAAVYRKSNVAAGENDWAFSNGGASKWAWYVCEIDGLDLVEPLDAAAAAANSVLLTAGNSGTRSTGTTAANPGTDTLQLACFASVSGAGSWASFTGGFEEVADVLSDAGTGPVGVGVARRLSGGAATGPFECSATFTCTTGSAQAFGQIVAYRAADSPIVNALIWQLGFEHGSHYGLSSPGMPGVTGPANIGGGAPGTNLIVQASSARAAPSAYGCRLVASAAAVNFNSMISTTTSNTFVAGFDVRVVSGSGTVVIAQLTATIGSALQLVYDVANTRFGLRWGAGTVSWQAGTTPLNTWAWVDLRMTGVKTATWHADWRIETAANTYTDQSAPADLTGQTPATGAANLYIGLTTAQTVTLDIDNIVLAVYASTYPLGPHTLQAVRVDPAGTPTVSGTVGNFALVTNNATGAALTSGTLTSARDALDDLPPTISAASDGVVQTATAAADYLQFPMDTVTVGNTRVIAAVRVLAPLISTTGNGAGTLGLRGWDGAAETVLLNPAAQAGGITPGSSTTVSATVPPYSATMWNPVNGWTQAKMDAAALRLGFSTDATPDEGVHALYLEVATRPALTARQISAEGDLFTVDVNLSPYSSASVSYVVTSSDAVRGATFSYSVAGVAQTPVYVAAATSTTVSVAAELFGDISDVTLTPDAP